MAIPSLNCKEIHPNSNQHAHIPMKDKRWNISKNEDFTIFLPWDAGMPRNSSNAENYSPASAVMQHERGTKLITYQ